MTVFLLLLVLLCVIGAEVKKENEFFEDYASLEKSNAIKGIFVVMVFFSHAKAYMHLTDANSEYYLGLQTYLAQMIVVPFLFFSGYGIMQSVMKKGTNYIKKIPTNRLLKVLLHFDIAVLLFVGLNLIIKREMTLSKVLWSLIGWESIGNSNWYILAILIAYAATFVAFIIFRKNHYLAAVVTTVLVVLAILFISKYRPGYYYNTMLTYCFGLWYALFKDKIDKICMKNEVIWLGVIGVCGAVYYLVHKNFLQSIWYYELWACMFMMLLLLFSMKISINNGILQFFGNHVFSIYILQRLPMDFINAHYNVPKIPYIFLVTSFVVTLIIALIFDFAMKKLDGIIFRTAKKS